MKFYRKKGAKSLLLVPETAEDELALDNLAENRDAARMKLIDLLTGKKHEIPEDFVEV